MYLNWEKTTLTQPSVIFSNTGKNKLTPSDVRMAELKPIDWENSQVLERHLGLYLWAGRPLPVICTGPKNAYFWFGKGSNPSYTHV